MKLNYNLDANWQVNTTQRQISRNSSTSSGSTTRVPNFAQNFVGSEARNEGKQRRFDRAYGISAIFCSLTESLELSRPAAACQRCLARIPWLDRWIWNVIVRVPSVTSKRRPWWSIPSCTVYTRNIFRKPISRATFFRFTRKSKFYVKLTN